MRVCQFRHKPNGIQLIIFRPVLPCSLFSPRLSHIQHKVQGFVYSLVYAHFVTAPGCRSMNKQTPQHGTHNCVSSPSLLLLLRCRPNWWLHEACAALPDRNLAKFVYIVKRAGLAYQMVLELAKHIAANQDLRDDIEQVRLDISALGGFLGASRTLSL